MHRINSSVDGLTAVQVLLGPSTRITARAFLSGLEVQAWHWPQGSPASSRQAPFDSAVRCFFRLDPSSSMIAYRVEHSDLWCMIGRENEA